jgi:hypothetical protein
MSRKRFFSLAAVVLAGAAIGAGVVVGVGWMLSGPRKGKR